MGAGAGVRKIGPFPKRFFFLTTAHSGGSQVSATAGADRGNAKPPTRAVTGGRINPPIGLPSIGRRLTAASSCATMCYITTPRNNAEPSTGHVHVTITHREMRNNSGQVLRRVDSGETIDVTNHGRVVARISPPLDETPLEESRRLGHTRAAVTPRSALREIKRARSGLSSTEILADARGRW